MAKHMVLVHIAFASVLIATAAPAMAQPIPYRSTTGEVDCGAGVLCGDPKAAPVSCTTDADCKTPANRPMGGLPFACLSDVHLCGYRNPSQPVVPPLNPNAQELQGK